jgi:hypothetical protein
MFLSHAIIIPSEPGCMGVKSIFKLHAVCLTICYGSRVWRKRRCYKISIKAILGCPFLQEVDHGGTFKMKQQR